MDSANEPDDRYDVVLLVERELTERDARVVRALHEGLDDQEVVYHLLLPMSDAAAAIEASMTAIGSGDLVVPPPNIAASDIAAVRNECRQDAERSLAASLRALGDAHAEAGTATVVEESPIETLAAKVKEVRVFGTGEVLPRSPGGEGWVLPAVKGRLLLEVPGFF